MYDSVIIGAGPAGLSAALYAGRAMLNYIVIEEMPLSGGQIINTHEVDNYIGIPKIGGFELAQKFREHADSYNTEFVEGRVVGINDKIEYKEIVLDGVKIIDSKTVIIATGASHRKLGVPGETELTGRGVSYCATCDGAFFKNKTVAIVGGGDTALEDAVFLSRICKTVYVIHRRDEFRGAKILSDRLKQHDNVKTLMNTTVEKINGKKKVESIEIKNKTDGSVNTLSVDGVFIAVGMQPNSKIAEGLLKLDGGDYIVADESCRTSVNGIFAAGDVRTKEVRQVITAASDGAAAVMSVQRFL